MRKFLFVAVLLLAGCAARPVHVPPPLPGPESYNVWDCAPELTGTAPRCTQVNWPKEQCPAGKTQTAVPFTGGSYIIVCQ